MRGLRLSETRRSRNLRADQTEAEAKLWDKLRGRRLGGFKFVRQESIAPFYVDFLCRAAKLIVEVDGATHSTPDEIAHDRRREQFMSESGYRVLRVTNDEVFTNLEGICETILAALQRL